MTVTEHGTVQIIRVFDFPRESVFKMWTDPGKVASWWGPEGCVTVVHEWDPRPGGTMSVDDQFPEGVVYHTTGSFIKIIFPELLVFKIATSAKDAVPWEAVHTLTFHELGPRKTQVTVLVNVVAAGSWPRDLDSLKKGYQEGYGQSFDKLQRALQRYHC